MAPWRLTSHLSQLYWQLRDEAQSQLRHSAPHLSQLYRQPWSLSQLEQCEHHYYHYSAILNSCRSVTCSENTGRGSGVRGLRCRGRALHGGRAAARTGGLCRRRGPPSGGRWSARGATSLLVPVIWPLGVSISRTYLLELQTKVIRRYVKISQSQGWHLLVIIASASQFHIYLQWCQTGGPSPWLWNLWEPSGNLRLKL